MTAIAIRLGQGRQKADIKQYPCDLGKVTCDKCGVVYAIGASPPYADLGKQYARYAETLLIQNHEREEEHPDSILLPYLLTL